MSNAILDIEKSDASSLVPIEEKGEAVDAKDNLTKPSPNADQEHSSTTPALVPKKSFKFKLTVFMLCLTSVAVAMDSVIVASSLAAITVDLKGESLEAFWVGTSYLLSQTVSVPTFVDLWIV